MSTKNSHAINCNGELPFWITINKFPYVLNNKIQKVYVYTDSLSEEVIVTYYTNGISSKLYPLIKNKKIFMQIKEFNSNLLPGSSIIEEFENANI